MVWNKALPGNSEKIRNLGVVIRPNWAAIEEGDSTFKPQALNVDNRTPLVVGNNPTAISDTNIFFCKDDPSGNPELFSIDDSSVISQLTFRARSLAQSGYSYIAPGFLMQWGRDTVTSGGSTKAVTFPIAFGSAPWSVVTNEYAQTQTGATARSSGPENSSIATTGFTYTVWGGTVPANVPFGYIAIGPV